MATVYIDAATKQNPYFSVGAAVIKNDSETFEETYILGNIDNNEAEWATLLETTKRLVELGINNAIIYTDSKIVVDTFMKNYVKDTRFKTYYNCIMKESQDFLLFVVSLIPREKNKHADHLAKTRLYKESK
ncbi:ribonuclease HI family protein [Phocicoccus pinnipedialis]|uniref:14.7 kDa ribonuclease H-like protein n=1 Tax=Phocicoccus pinnipedialis TaxID=110845 RepID=A0A6V7RCR2_9BACL|nr:ribonuclease HI family protein [Jeotgalicoccus pinnipedialis]CAD2075531.1 14.7 kDa ribonuclease H-like protein [Jeotgalicoccus pinnipedialis]